ncbi:structural maintenance-chromosome 3 (chondroitin sulfate proteoglycan 6) [Fusarium proliferatum]|uniref:Structural maintenance of chromosomes protein n=2 Tax=Gibberella intermedia TaxID=948311 RepID=A0A1L7VH89_FUSPR|nr:related to SMC3-required for structural maintenance of chromosomes [Fusarium proliferatum ET1]KAG4260424.1 structural maintenance-chromosome 3 (chondroitin sulfate proteoglycan 6) [Fusarium proliferatum]KAG4276261.1 structural maintenance-chromosome 3 (chondroitin sulfate proteoglycan 6) [Fusarium proliferatum]KAG4290584.1 structural maintenance-chromosome 3 (chondroitin sulfate proteoglycan 6) [Fusarium proliferatum]RBA09398.1 structural maintenance-chromosome 3 (chondroitin sulfate proteog
MYIKQIIIQGFKSYKDQTVIEPFSPKTNVIVGRNGSGKSNFFAAIRFVLSDAYTQMSREERQGLLHEGSGSAVMSAYVEIIFDNSDDRFPTGNKEVILRRTIGLKKDEYSVDRKVVTKADVMNLLEAAGFSRSNPYYIVPQGRVTALTNMKESDRLNLLKEVAGTHVYETRRAESLKIMNETNNKREKIDELLEYIKERLSELEEEKEELRAFQDKDRERRCLEYAYYHNIQLGIQANLDELDNARQDGIDSSDTNRAEYADGEKAISRLDSEIHKLQREMELLQIERRQVEEDRRDGAKALAKAEMKVKNLREGQSAQEQARTQHAAELESVQNEIASKEQQLSTISPAYNQKKQEEDEIRRQLDHAEATRNRLFAKQGRGTQFRNKSERDAWLRKEIQELELNISTQKANKIDADEEVERVQQSIAQAEQDVADLRSRLANFPDERIALEEEAAKARDIIDKLNDERKLVRREDDKLNSVIANARQEKETAERELAHAMDGSTARGLATIRRLKQERDIPGAYGTLAELLEVSDAYRLPVEQIAGASLFHYVVDNADTATYLADTLYRQQGGRVTFMPLAQLRPRQIKLPRSNDAVPLLSKITFNEEYEKAFQQVFGKAVVCPNLTVASQYARSHGVDGITPEGDTTNKRGAMTGGYIDPRKSRLHAVQAVNKWRDEYERLLAQSRDIRKQTELKDQEITAAMSDLQKANERLRQAVDGVEPLNHELFNKLKHLNKEQSHLEAAKKRRDAVEKNMNSFLEDLAAHEAELGSDFKKTLTAAEERQLEELGTSTQELQKQWNELSRARRDLERQKQLLEVDLRQNLQMKLDQLNSQAFEDSTGSSGGGLKDAQRELKKAQKAQKAVEASLQELETKMDDTQARLEELANEKTQLEQVQSEISAKIERQQKKMDRSLRKKAVLSTQAAECAQTIRDLGVLPEEAFDKYENMDPNQVSTKIKKVNEALKKYKHVNKKAFEQYNNFTTQQDQLMKRRKELDDSQESIEVLVEHLDRRKDEAIERTFKQVSKEFTTIFGKLVPAGHGRLLIQRRADRRQEPVDESDGEVRSVENYTGVGISVSFNSKHLDEQQKIQQLSGGQKSLCALCLIFALQATESSPMVIFDEVDANLDAQYRTAVAALLESISKEIGTQFICTTFRPEIVHVADRCYGVTFRTKTSSIDCVSTEQALEFVEGQAKPT